ncbi:MAG TPA: hypothetical protein VER33_04480, partial [Polyangiaceae bacterium]|nr:hypothetical protein [Polyangiaceae bacterium]
DTGGTGGTGAVAGASSGSGGKSAAGGSFSMGGSSAGGTGVGGSAFGGTTSAGGTAGTNNPAGGTSAGGAAAGSSTGGSAQGGTANGGASMGGAQGGGGGKSMGGAGGASMGGAPTGGSGGSPAGSYPCDGSTTGYNALMIKTGSTWVVTNAGKQVYSGADMEAALRAAYGSLTAGRTSKQSILVQGSGDIPANSQVPIPSYTVVNVCGTVNVSGTGAGADKSPFYARNARDIEIPNLKMTGAPAYGIFFRGTNNMHLGNIDLRLSTSSPGIGIRVDTSASAGTDSTFNQNLRIDRVFGSGMSSHIVETYGINNITIGTVEGENVGECGVLLNRSTNATVDLVSCTDCASGAGYAAFRMANNNGRLNNGYATVNIVAKKVVARGGGRGIFSVSGSGAARIEHVDIQDTGNNSILLENAHNVTVGNAAQQSRIASSGELRIAGTSSDIRMQNIAVSGTAIREEPCATGSTWTNVNGAPTNCN